MQKTVTGFACVFSYAVCVLQTCVYVWREEDGKETNALKVSRDQMVLGEC